MKKEKTNLPETTSLRQKAEEHLRKNRRSEILSLNEGDALKLLHELEVHQIELEMQGEELRMARDEEKEATDKYNELYDFALTGHFTIDSTGKIYQLNLSAATMLGTERAKLVGKDFKQFVTMDSMSDFSLFFHRVIVNDQKQTSEIKLKVVGNTAIHVLIEGISLDDDEKYQIRVIDITKQKRAEQLLKFKTMELEQYNEMMEFNDGQLVSLKKEINLLLMKLGENEKFEMDE